jgi:AcrR family transcriptional regulator/predicted DNA-binding transcriptional regulator AlpA
MMPEPRLLTMRELEELSGFPRHTIHLYIKEGLLHEAIKTGKTMAYYNDSHLERLKAIRDIKGGRRLPLHYLQEVLAQEGTARKKVAKVKTKAEGTGQGKNVSEKSKQRIKNVALAIFQEKGYYQTRTQDITAAAGVSIGTFYLHYRNKSELFLDAIEDMIENVLPLFEAEIDKEPNLMRRVLAKTQVFIYSYEFYSELGYVLLGIAASRDPRARERVNEIFNKLMEFFKSDVVQAIKVRMVREIDPELLTRAIMGMVEFLAFRLSMDDKYTYEQITSFVIDLVMNGAAMERSAPIGDLSKD